MAILLTGGLGYIGSHISILLGKEAIIIDNQSNSSLNFRKYLPLATVYKKDISFLSLNNIFSNHKIDGVIHLAGLKSVSESILNPLKYYDANINSTIELLTCMKKYSVNKLIFSSSATVYGDTNKSPLNEKMSMNSKNPYGKTKIMIENILSDFAFANKRFKAVSLRYFNPLGADYENGLSERPLGEPQNIMPILLKCAYQQKVFKIFGNDYDTIDGTCIRDYIHVKDLAHAHIIALKKIQKIKGHIPINVGLGKGKSVLEIIKIFEKENKIKLKYNFSKKRDGDVAISYADNKKFQKIFQWEPKLNYKDMVRDSWLGFKKKN